MEFDPIAAYKKSMNDPEAKKKYDEGWDRIFGNKNKEICQKEKEQKPQEN